MSDYQLETAKPISHKHDYINSLITQVDHCQMALYQCLKERKENPNSRRLLLVNLENRVGLVLCQDFHHRLIFMIERIDGIEPRYVLMVPTKENLMHLVIESEDIVKYKMDEDIHSTWFNHNDLYGDLSKQTFALHPSIRYNMQYIIDNCFSAARFEFSARPDEETSKKLEQSNQYLKALTEALEG